MTTENRMAAKDFLPCTCDIMYKSRGMAAPDCPYCQYGDEVDERIGALIAEKEALLDVLADIADSIEEYRNGWDHEPVRDAWKIATAVIKKHRP
jgi:hypothetical protein